MRAFFFFCKIMWIVLSIQFEKNDNVLSGIPRFQPLWWSKYQGAQFSSFKFQPQTSRKHPYNLV